MLRSPLIQSYEVRYASLSVYDLKAPAPVYKSVSDDEFRDFYYDLYGAQVWEEDMGRNVSMIVSTSQDALSRYVCVCAPPAHLHMQRLLAYIRPDGDLNMHMPSFVFRFYADAM